jgi:hypothetical protein
MQVKHKQRVLAAERVRRHRCNASVTPEKRSCNADVTNEQKDVAYIHDSLSLEESSLEEKKSSLGKKKGNGKAPDPRSKHPAILAVKSVMSRYPKKELWDEMIQFLGNSPDAEKIQSCYLAWIKRGYNPLNYAWLFDWTVTGVPEKGGFNGKAQIGKSANDASKNGAYRTTEEDGIRTPQQL